MSKALPEVWMRGVVEGYEPLLQPVVHAFLQVKEDLDALVANVEPADVWARPGNAASVGYHVRHLGGATDRLLTYARGEALTPDQIAFMKSEAADGAPLADIVADTRAMLDRALEQVRGTLAASLLEPRKVGRAGLPSTTLGLLF